MYDGNKAERVSVNYPPLAFKALCQEIQAGLKTNNNNNYSYRGIFCCRYMTVLGSKEDRFSLLCLLWYHIFD